MYHLSGTKKFNGFVEMVDGYGPSSPPPFLKCRPVLQFVLCVMLSVYVGCVEANTRVLVGESCWSADVAAC